MFTYHCTGENLTCNQASFFPLPREPKTKNALSQVGGNKGSFVLVSKNQSLAT